MNTTRLTIIHNLVRYPVMAISIPLQCAALLLKYAAEGLNKLSIYWGDYLIKKYVSKKKPKQ